MNNTCANSASVHVHKSSAQSRLEAVDHHQQSLVLRQKKVLKRDDSGIFSSSPSPLTPSRDVHAVFSPLVLASTTTGDGVMSTSSSSRRNGEEFASSHPPSTSDQLLGSTNGGVSRAGSQPTLNHGDPGINAPSQDDIVYRAFHCLSSSGPEYWASCSHAHCTTIRNQWKHFKTCLTTAIVGQLCTECRNFHSSLISHAVNCQTDSCIVSLCANVKSQLRDEGNTAMAATVRNGHNHPVTLLRSNSVRDSIDLSQRTPFGLLDNHQGSLDDMALSPASHEDYQIGTLPKCLRHSYSKRAEQIVKEMGLEEPLNDVTTAEPAAPPAQSASKYPMATGILSPIEEHPPSHSEEERASYPSQTVLHPLQPMFLTQGKDGCYFQRRDYDLNEHLGSGGFGACACAKDHKTDKMFVIKSNKFTDEKMVNSLRAESNILARIPQHENITTFLGAVIEEVQSPDGPVQNCRLMMELAEHGSLASMLLGEEGGVDPLPLDQSLFYINQILMGVCHLHSLGIVHLDIKAENVLVLEGGRRVKLTDFGTAVHIDEIVGCVSKLTGLTPHFTAPEIIRGDIPSFSSDVWSTMCVLIQLITGHLPGYFNSTVSRESMMYMLGNYTDGDIEKLVPLSALEDHKEVCDLFHDTLRVDSHLRPSAMQLLHYPILDKASEYEQYFDIDCTQYSEQEADAQSGAEPSSEGAESLGTTLPTSLPHLITGSGEDSDVSLDRPVRGKRVSQDSGVSSRYDRALSEVFSVMDINDDSGIDTPCQEHYTPPHRQTKVNLVEGVITEDREGEERLTSIPDRTQSQPEAPVDYTALASRYRQRSMSATYQRPVHLREGVGSKFGHSYIDWNDTFFSLPAKPSAVYANPSKKTRPSFVHLIHSNSAPVMSTEEGVAGGPTENRNGVLVPRRLRRSSSEVYVDRGPDIDTPEEKKKKRELALAKQAEDHEQMVSMGTGATVNTRVAQSSSSNESFPTYSPPSQRSHASSSSGSQSDHSSDSYHGSRYGGRQSGPNSAMRPPQPQYAHPVQRRGYIQETLV